MPAQCAVHAVPEIALSLGAEPHAVAAPHAPEEFSFDSGSAIQIDASESGRQCRTQRLFHHLRMQPRGTLLAEQRRKAGLHASWFG
jgi:hypothetical protein